jgi:hypothetical protein
MIAVRLLVFLVLLAAPLDAHAQPAGKIARIGVLYSRHGQQAFSEATWRGFARPSALRATWSDAISRSMCAWATATRSRLSRPS